jgi:BirA family biotin operon repressor/biotin-[acetyl-CoA-carboxylase] ligase
VIRALRRLGVDDVGVKWPNDILAQGRKLAGILLEMTGESAGPCAVVTGIGINYQMPASGAKAIDQSWIDMASLSSSLPGRNMLVAVLIEEIAGAYHEFSERGLAEFLSEWQKSDCYRGKSVILHGANGEVQGVAQGVDEQGGLRLEAVDGMHTFHSGEVSLRPAHTN